MNFQTKKGYPLTFWIANLVELFERWAWYGFFIIFGIYLTNSPETGALGFSQTQKGILIGTITAMVYLLTIFTGAIADKIGYKKTLVFSFLLYFTGFILLTIFRSYPAVFFAYAIVGIGAAFFKPIVSATIAKTTTDKNASLGFGIFYMMVNIGAFIGPIIASVLRKNSWTKIFWASALIIFLNTILVILFYKEPQKTNEQDTDTIKETISKIINNIATAFKDIKLLWFLILIIGFWTMYNQFFYSLPIFIEHWINTSTLYHALENILPALAHKLGNADKNTLPAEIIVNLDALYIIVFQMIISSFVKKFQPLKTMISGIIIATIGMSLSFFFHNAIYLVITILIFSIGEMASSPKITEYIGKVIAPEDKKALYIGMSFLPVAGGNLLAGIISGNAVFGRLSDKYELAKRLLIKNNIDLSSLGENFTKDQLWEFTMNKLHLTNQQLTDLLWNRFHPYNFWIWIAAIGSITVIGLFLYNKYVIKK